MQHVGVAPHSTTGTFYVRPVTPLPCCPGVCDPASWLRTFDQGRWRRWGQRGPARPVSTVLRSAAGFRVALPGVRGRPLTPSGRPAGGRRTGADGVSLSEARAPPRASRAVCRVPHTALGLRGAAGAAERVWGQRGHAAPLKTGLRRTVSDETGLLPAAASEHRQRERPRRVSRCGDRPRPPRAWTGRLGAPLAGQLAGYNVVVLFQFTRRSLLTART